MRGPVFSIVAVIFSAALLVCSVSAQDIRFSDAEIWELSRAVREDDPEALEKLRTLAESGVARAQLALASVYRDVGMLLDYDESVKWNLAAAKQGLPVAQVNIASYYSSADDEVRDLEKAVFWLQLAADQGNWKGAGSLGNLYRGHLVESVDLVQAYRWYTVAMRILREEGRREILESIRSMRSQIAERMTMTQVAEAEILAAQWVRRDWSELEARLAELK